MSDFTYEPVVPTATTDKPKDTQPQFTYEPIGTPGSSTASARQETKDKASISVLAQQAGVSSYVTEAIQNTADPSFKEKWASGLDWAERQRQIDALSYRQALGDKSPETASEVKKLQGEQSKGPQANFLQNFISGAGEQGAAGLRAGGMWLLGAMSWPYRKLAEATGLSGLQSKQDQMLSQIGSDFGLSQERVQAITANPVTGLGESAKEATAGIAGPVYRSLVDAGTNPDIASTASFTIGGALTALQMVPAGRLIPGVQRIGEESFKAAVIAVAKNGGLGALAKL